MDKQIDEGRHDSIAFTDSDYADPALRGPGASVQLVALNRTKPSEI